MQLNYFLKLYLRIVFFCDLVWHFTSKYPKLVKYFLYNDTVCRILTESHSFKMMTSDKNYYMYVINVYYLQINFLFSYTFLCYSHKSPSKYLYLQEWIFFSFYCNYILLIMLLQLSCTYPLCPPPASTLHSLRQSPHHCSWHVSCMRILWWLHFLYCTLHPHGYSVPTYLYFLIPSPLHPFSYTPFLPSVNHHNALCSHDSASVLLICLVRF